MPAMTSAGTIPVALFAHARPEHLERTLRSLEANRVPRIYAFSDGPRDRASAGAVGGVRELLRSVRWCELTLIEREENLGLGRSILAGIDQVLGEHDRAIVFEDDLVCAPGTYRYLCAALERYRDDPRVASVSAWNHPRLTPGDAGDRPYFSGRGEIWGWGTWSRAWRHMERGAAELLAECRRRGVDPYRYGADLPVYAEIESDRNIWAVRFNLSQMLEGGLSLCPPWSMVENIGFDASATNTAEDSGWSVGALREAPSIPDSWPEPIEHPEAAALCRMTYGEKPGLITRWSGRTRRSLGRLARSAGILPAR